MRSPTIVEVAQRGGPIRSDAHGRRPFPKLAAESRAAASIWRSEPCRLPPPRLSGFCVSILVSIRRDRRADSAAIAFFQFAMDQS
ncbi:hypothetical protein, partial [Candidatus Methylacidiphilum fumarolicum]|uniref:hypothetical protein n=1 Tax=Candidatus Methylacidiphilum fumarolicum TaxID=591154 RepID=UPI001CA51957